MLEQLVAEMFRIKISSLSTSACIDSPKDPKDKLERINPVGICPLLLDQLGYMVQHLLIALIADEIHHLGNSGTFGQI